MKYLMILGLLLLTSCTFQFENGKCYSHRQDKMYEYGHVYVEGYFYQYDKRGKAKGKIYARPDKSRLDDNIMLSEISCPARFPMPYNFQVEDYKELGVWEDIKRVLNIKEE